MTSKNISEVLNEFKKPQNHILIGTEMIAKGHDFSDVTVVGIINIDQMLNLPFYNTTFFSNYLHCNFNYKKVKKKEKNGTRTNRRL